VPDGHPRVHVCFYHRNKLTKTALQYHDDSVFNDEIALIKTIVCCWDYGWVIQNCPQLWEFGIVLSRSQSLLTHHLTNELEVSNLTFYVI
jgi:hypothetical protein